LFGQWLAVFFIIPNNVNNKSIKYFESINSIECIILLTSKQVVTCYQIFVVVVPPERWHIVLPKGDHAWTIAFSDNILVCLYQYSLMQDFLAVLKHKIIMVVLLITIFTARPPFCKVQKQCKNKQKMSEYFKEASFLASLITFYSKECPCQLKGKNKQAELLVR